MPRKEKDLRSPTEKLESILVFFQEQKLENCPVVEIEDAIDYIQIIEKHCEELCESVNVCLKTITELRVEIKRLERNAKRRKY